MSAFDTAAEKIARQADPEAFAIFDEDATHYTGIAYPSSPEIMDRIHRALSDARQQIAKNPTRRGDAI